MRPSKPIIGFDGFLAYVSAGHDKCMHAMRSAGGEQQVLERSVREHDAELGQIEGDGWRKRGTTALAAIGAVAPVTFGAAASIAFRAVVAAAFALFSAPFAVALVLLAAAQQELDALAARGRRRQDGSRRAP